VSADHRMTLYAVTSHGDIRPYQSITEHAPPASRVFLTLEAATSFAAKHHPAAQAEMAVADL
jgi:hypothetical protein